MDDIRVQFPSVLFILNIIFIKINLKGTWSSLVYGARFENEYLNKVVSSNLTVSDDSLKRIKIQNKIYLFIYLFNKDI